MCVGVREPIVGVHLHSYDRDPRFAARTPDLGAGAPMTVADGPDHVWPEATAQAIARLRAARHLAPAERWDIVFGDAARLFGWADLAGCGDAAIQR